MKLITAMVRSERLPSVKEELFKAGVGKLTVTNVIGAGQQQGYEEMYRGIKHEIKLIKKVRLDVAVNDEYEKVVIDAIITGAKTGNIGDGKIWVTEISNCVRIRTGETGQEAIG
jgi:nitrogen regulatory protein P-II 2